jgi:hypothetical protein
MDPKDYDYFLTKVDLMLVAKGKQPIDIEDVSTVVHSYGYGKSAEETIENILFNRKYRK